jgi:fatty-acid desaturase
MAPEKQSLTNLHIPHRELAMLQPEAKTLTRPPVHNSAQDLERRVAWLVVVVPLAGFVVATVYLWGQAVSALDLGLCLGLAFVTLAGITAGFHRFFTHGSFESHPAVRWALGIAGSMAVQGPLLFWVACHRRHHQHSDEAEDPHSPRQGGSGRSTAPTCCGWCWACLCQPRRAGWPAAPGWAP